MSKCHQRIMLWLLGNTLLKLLTTCVCVTSSVFSGVRHTQHIVQFTNVLLYLYSLSRLWVKSASLEVVYCWAAARWAAAFLSGPWGNARGHYAHVRDTTRATLTRHWATMMRAHPVSTRRYLNHLQGNLCGQVVRGFSCFFFR